MNDPVCHRGILVQVSGAKRNGNLGTMMNNTSLPNQVIDLAVHQTHFNLNIRKLSTKVSVIFLQLRESVSKVRDRAGIKELDFKRGSLGQSEIANVLPSPSGSFEKFKSFKGVSRDDKHMMSDTFLTIERYLRVRKDSGQEVNIG